MLNVLSLGAGIQSSTLLLMSCRGVLPKLDAAVFSDTGWESRAVYEHLDWLKEQAAAAGIPVAVLNHRNIREDALVSRVRGHAEDGDRWAAMPLYTLNPDGSIGRIKRQCSAEYKLEPIAKYIRRELLQLAPGERAPRDAVDQWVGISTDEMRRIRRSDEHWRRNVYPLCGIPDVMLPRGYSRLDCKAWLMANYPGRNIPRSSCIGCPFRSNTEWRDLKQNRPDEWEDACQFDEAIRNCGGIRGQVFLHRTCRPLREVNLDEDQMNLWTEECLGVCGN